MLDRISLWIVLLAIAPTGSLFGDDPALQWESISSRQFDIDPGGQTNGGSHPVLAGPDQGGIDLGAVPEGRAVAVHAAGAVQFEFPEDWMTREVPYRRELRLFVGPQLPPAPATPKDGLWIVCRYRQALPDDHAALREFALRRIRSLDGGDLDLLEAPRFAIVSDHPGLEVRFRSGSEDDQRQGLFVLVATPWGHVELCAWTSQEKWLMHESGFAMVRQSLQIRTPQEPQALPAPSVADAESILGSWKSYRGRLRLAADGRVSIVADRDFQSTSADGTQQSSQEIMGYFRAERDLLFIEWTDGSKLNYRWRQAGSRLLLTDHNGRMTQLYPLLETF